MQRNTITSIQYLRAIAAMMVVLWHAQIMIPSFPNLVPYMFGNAGVYLFFAVSGFLMFHVTETREHAATEFLKARIIRVVPIYWFYTFGSAALMLLVPGLFTGNELSANHLVLSLLFIPHTISAYPEAFLPMLKVGWTLIYEAFFYVVFAGAMFVSYKNRALVSSALLFFLSVGYLVLYPSHGFLFPLYVYGDPIVLQFVFGIWIAVFLVKFPYFRLRASWATPVTLLLCFLLLGGDFLAGQNHLLRLFFYGIPTALFLVLALSIAEWRAFKSRLLSLLGDASYSIYLVHMFPLAVLRWVWGWYGLPRTGVGAAISFVFIAAVLSAVCGIASYLLIERRILDIVRGRR